jgi:histidine triad (HIT) family protein
VDKIGWRSNYNLPSEIRKVSMPTECLFCRIIVGEIPATIVYRDERVVAIRDIAPKAPTHILVMPIQHLASLAEAQAADESLLGALLLAAGHIARQEGVAERGYRVTFNTREEGGQTVGHLHAHLLGGRPLSGELG